MGRGRAKAKQTKVARELKYSGGGTDLDRLRAELVTGNADAEPAEEVEEDEVDPYAKYVKDDPYPDERRSG
ncbi:MAG TPA: DUF3073 domain-containing protein [Sporichthyaceae bacterium]|jgi:hypothetical protein|nr:DUF3073 domain-containing protein [Sporichthyaceae bacterium]